ncbi:MAG: glycosyl transferase [Allorhizobium sp.]
MAVGFEQALKEYQAGRLAEALRLAQGVLAEGEPGEPALFALIGNIQFKSGNRAEAAQAFARAADGISDEIDGKAAAAYLKLAVTLAQAAGLFDLIASIGLRAVRLNPDAPELTFVVASALFRAGRLAEMEPLLQRLDRCCDRHMALIVNHHRLTGRFEALSAELDRALAERPDDIFLNVSKFAVAREVLDFPTIARHEALMRTPDAPFSAALIAAEPALGRILWSDDEALNARPSQEGPSLAATLPSVTGRRRRAFSAPGERIRIGYLSNDFHGHATMTLFLEVMAAHDPERFDVTLFCHTERHAAAQQAAWPDDLRARIVPVGPLTDEAVAALISERGIDILVDLKGHTMGARLGIVNLSDAPVKVTYLGFPGSVTGVDLDYAITDPIITPDSAKPFYAEKLCRLPESYQPNNRRTRPRPKPMERADAGLPEDAFVFASFNASYKITPSTLSLWVAVLAAVPEALLWILCRLPQARRNLQAEMTRRGIDPARLVFADHRPYPAHVSRLPLADLALDTRPWNGHTTTSDMLWAGLPVLSSRGQSFASRVSASLLTAIGLPELIAESDDDFVDKAVMLARDPYALTALRARLDAARFTAPLFDNERFCRHLERGYEAMAARARAGLPPDHIDIAALPARTGPFA